MGEQMGETWFFRPDTKVTREEFLAMAMDLVDLDEMIRNFREYTGLSEEEFDYFYDCSEAPMCISLN